MPEELGGRTLPPCCWLEKCEGREGTQIARGCMEEMLEGQQPAGVPSIPSLFIPGDRDVGNTGKWGLVSPK